MGVVCRPSTWRIIPVSKWLVTMVSFRPLNGVVPLINGLNGLYMGVTNYLLSGMILQVFMALLTTPIKIKIGPKGTRVGNNPIMSPYFWWGSVDGSSWKRHDLYNLAKL